LSRVESRRVTRLLLRLGSGEVEQEAWFERNETKRNEITFLHMACWLGMSRDMYGVNMIGRGKGVDECLCVYMRERKREMKRKCVCVRER